MLIALTYKLYICFKRQNSEVSKPILAKGFGFDTPCNCLCICFCPLSLLGFCPQDNLLRINLAHEEAYQSA